MWDNISVKCHSNRSADMYLDMLVKVPDVKGKITRRTKGETTYINYKYGRVYDAERKFNIPQRATIGKAVKGAPDMMQPNRNYLLYFPDAELPETKQEQKRCSCLRVGAFIALQKIIESCKLPEILGHYFDPKDRDLFLDLMIYSIITENNAGQYYPDYGYNHPLFSSGMKIYSDSRVFAFLKKIGTEQRVGFLNEWNENREKIYISYDSTNKNCQAGDIRLAEFGHAKDGKGLPVLNYSIAYDTKN